MKVIIAGTRNIEQMWVIEKAIALWAKPIGEVVSGAARGVDTLGELWATKRGIPVKRFPADWGKHGKSAGPIRNKVMAEYADGLIAVWDGKSKGTANMIWNMQQRGKPYTIFRVSPDPAFDLEFTRCPETKSRCFDKFCVENGCQHTHGRLTSSTDNAA